MKTKIIFSAMLIALSISVVYGITFSVHAAGQQCHSSSKIMPLPLGFGSPFNIIIDSREPIMTATCSGNSAEVTVGNGDLDQFIYQRGYIWGEEEWKSFEFECTEEYDNNWCRKSATAKVPKKEDAFFAAYTCLQVGDEWKCGCRDYACRGTNSGLWQLQGIGEEIEQGSSGNNGGGGDQGTGGLDDTNNDDISNREVDSFEISFSPKNQSIQVGDIPNPIIIQQGEKPDVFIENDAGLQFEKCIDDQETSTCSFLPSEKPGTFNMIITNFVAGESLVGSITVGGVQEEVSPKPTIGGDDVSDPGAEGGFTLEDIDLSKEIFEEMNAYRTTRGLNVFEWSSYTAGRATRHSQGIVDGTKKWHDGLRERMKDLNKKIVATRIHEDVTTLNIPFIDEGTVDIPKLTRTFISQAGHRDSKQAEFTGIGVVTNTEKNTITITQIYVEKY